MEWLEAHGRLEERRKTVVRRQQRELQKQKREAEAREKELQKLVARCREMEEEERLSVEMEAWYRDEEERKRMELQRLEELKLYQVISSTRKKTMAMGLSVSTPGASGLQRLRLLEARIMEKELVLKKANEAKIRLDVLPLKRNKLKQLMHSFFFSSTRKKVEQAIYHQHWDRLVPLFDPATTSSGNRSTDLLNHESENGFTPVLVAIFRGKLKVLRQLLELGASPNTETRSGMTPLLAVVMTGDIVALSILVDFQVELNYETKNQVNAVLLAVDKGREEILNALLENGANVDGVNGIGRSTLIQASISGNANTLRILLAYGARKELRDRDGKAALDWAIQLRYPAMISTLNSSLTSTNLLAQLKAEGEDENEEVLSHLSTNRLVRQKRKAEMDKAMRNSDLQRIRELLSFEELQISPNYEDVKGNTPLLVACTTGTYADIVSCLKSNCIPTHRNREGISALMTVCKRGDIATILLLMKCGCSLSTRDFSGRDSFSYLNSYDHPDLAIEFTNKYHNDSNGSSSGLYLGNTVSSVTFVNSEYMISLAQADISFDFELKSDRSSRTIGETRNLGCIQDEEGEEEPVNDPVIRKWGIHKQTLKQDRQRRQLFDKERERILAARTRGRRNGLIAPLPSDPVERLKFPTCDNCQKSRARKRCPACDQILCDKCHARLHELASRRHHQYEELKPDVYVGQGLKEIVHRNQENSLSYSVLKSTKCVAEMRTLLRGEDYLPPVTVSPRSIDPEVENYQRKKRIKMEKAISQMQINVPVAAAKHAAKAGEESIFTQPAEIELAALYTTQKKYEKAQGLLAQVEKLITDSLGILHPTMLTVAIGKARISQDTGQLEQCVGTMEDALSLFEAILPLDHSDILTATSMLLQSLDKLEHYHKAVLTCQHVYSIQVRALPSTHKSLKNICQQLDEFIAKREIVEMSNEDLVILEKKEQERIRMEQLAIESQKHMVKFRHLMTEDPEGLAAFLTFARQEFAEDLVTFWLSIEEFKLKTLRSRAVATYLTYVKSRRIKVITAAQRKKIKKAITNPGKKLSHTIYDEVQAQVFELVYRGVYARYLTTSQVKALQMPTTWAISPRRHASRYRVDGNSSPPPSESSSDEGEDQYKATRTRADHRQQTPEKLLNRKIARARKPTRAEAYRDDITSRSNSRFERRSTDRNERISPSEESGDVYITTMDEDDQQMFIALFYWRRKVIEAHFSAWKWVIFTLRRSERQTQRREINIRPSRPLSIGYESTELRPTRRNLILKRHTGPPSVEESEKTYSDVALEKRVQRKLPSISDTNSDRDISPGSNTEKRRQFREQLRLVYSCFEQWKTNTGKDRSRRVQQLVQAAGFHRVQLLKTSLRAWKTGSRTHKAEKKRLDDADLFRSSRTKCSVLHEWKRYCRIEREITRRRCINATQRKLLAFQHWRENILKTGACRKLAEKTSYRHLRLILKALRDGIIQARQERWKTVAATSHYRKKRQLQVLYLWKKAIFEDPPHLLSIDHSVRVSLTTGVRRWRRFTNERQTQAQNVLLADFFRYRTLLRHAVQAWGQFLDWKQRRNQLYDQVRRHHERTLTARSIYQLRVAATVNQTLRGKVRKATRWHQRKLTSQNFKKWVNFAQISARIKTFRRARIVTKVFRTWRSQAMTRQKLRTTQRVVSERWGGLILKTYMARWLRTLHVVSFANSIALKRRNLNTAIHFHAWQNWSKAKISRRNIVVQHHRRNEEALLERIVSQWLGVVLRKRCFKRLVKLFQKKQSRSRVKAIFRLWHLHVHISVATRKRDLDQARLFLVEWKRVCKTCREKRMGMAVARQYYSERRYALAIKMWFAFTRRTSSSRRADSEALSHYFRRILVMSLRNWYIAVRKLRRRTEFLANRQQLREEKTTTQYLRSWYSLTRQQAQRRIRTLAALQFQVEGLQRRSFRAWLGFLDTRRASCEQALFAITTHKNLLQGKVLRAWRQVTRRSVQLKRSFALVRRTTKQRRLQSSVDSWAKFSFERQHQRKQFVMADNFCNEYLKCLAMFQWQEKWSQTVLVRQKGLAVTRQMNDRRLAKGFSYWYGNFLHNSIIRSKKTKAWHFYSKRMQTKHFGLWKSYHEAVRYQVSKRRRIAIQQQHKLLSRMFRRWYRFSEAREAQTRLTNEAEAHRAVSVLNRVFQRWKGYRSKRTLHIIAYTYRKKLLLRNVWLGWKQHRKYIAIVRQNVLVTSLLVRNNLFRATFVQWKTYVVHRREGQAALNRAEDHWTLWLCKRGVTGLRKHLRFQQAVVKAATLGKITGTRYFWSRWRRFIAVQRSKRSRRVAVERAYAKREIERHFCAWKTLTRRCIQALWDKSDALYHVSCLRLTWARWNRVVKWRRCLIAMGNRRIDHLQVAILRRWRGYVDDIKNQRVKTAKAVAFRRANLRSKAWKSWLRYVTYCNDKQKQLEWVFSYYSVEVLLRRCLTSWKELIERRQVQREHQQVADSFNTHRLLCGQYRQWREFVDGRKLQQERIEALLHTSEMLTLSRAVKKWRTRAIVLLRQHQSEAAAAQFYSKRRLNSGLNKFIRWRTSQKIDRGLMTQAKRFRDNTVVVACFRCWQRYHHWRVKYAHLTLVFKRNQKEDIFTQWKSYWKKRQSSNDKRLQARISHCVHLEQNMLRMWRTFVLLRKQKKMTIAFNTAKVLRRTFDFWRRRAHVLRKMRKMFASQESFRAQTHFEAWKRFVAAKKQKAERLQKAMKFKNNLRKLDVWQKLRAFVITRRQEQATIELAVGFHQRFSTRKIFAVWEGRVGNWKRRRRLTNQAQLQRQSSLLRQGFQLLIRCKQSKRRLAQLQSSLSFQLVEKRKRRAISRLRALCTESDRKRGLIKRACHHWQLCHQEKYWGRILHWFKAAQFRKQQRLQADFFARTHLLQRYIRALKAHIRHTKQLKVKVDAFRCRYFRSVADDCFYQWKSFTVFKLKLRGLRQQRLQSQRRQRLHQWHRITKERVRRREGIQGLVVRRHYRELVVWFNHWESVCTDQWLDKELIAHHRRHAQKQRRLRFAVNSLKSQLPARYERLKCNTFFLQYHRAFLRKVLQHWKLATVDQ